MGEGQRWSGPAGTSGRDIPDSASPQFLEIKEEGPLLQLKGKAPNPRVMDNNS